MVLFDHLRTGISGSTWNQFLAAREVLEVEACFLCMPLKSSRLIAYGDAVGRVQHPLGIAVLLDAAGVFLLACKDAMTENMNQWKVRLSSIELTDAFTFYENIGRCARERM